MTLAIRIAADMSGGALLGGAIAGALGANVLAGAVIGSLAGLVVAILAARASDSAIPDWAEDALDFRVVLCVPEGKDSVRLVTESRKCGRIEQTEVVLTLDLTKGIPGVRDPGGI